MSARLLIGSSFVFLAAVPVMAGLSHDRKSGASLAEAFATPQPLTTPIRLERTPRMDGVYRPEEWDLLWGQVPSAAPAPSVTPAVEIKPLTPPPAPAPAPTQTQTAKPVEPVQSPPPAGGTILTGPIGPTTTDTGHAKGPSSTPIDQLPAKPPQTPPPAQAPATTPVKPVDLQPTTPTAKPPTPVVQQTPPPPPAPAPAAQAAFMSWEPGKLYFAAMVTPGDDMVVTIDGSNNGFLVGKDNLELRVTPGASPIIKARILDATAAAGPAWVEATGFEMSSTAVSAPQPNGLVFVELAVADPGYGILKTNLKDTVGVRVDGIASSAPPTDANLPRVMSQVQLADQRVSNLPDGLGATVAEKGRSVVAGSSTNVKWILSGSETNGVKYLEISGEGGFGDKVNMLRVPSPSFDPRGRSTVDYPTRIVPDAPSGYSVLKGELTGAGWVGATVESSMRVAPDLDIVAKAKSLKTSVKAQRIDCGADIVSNTDLRVEGNFQVLPPSGWRVIDGTDKDFFIYDKGAKAIRGFILEAPAGVRGTFKTTIRVMALGKTFEQPYWITIL